MAFAASTQAPVYRCIGTHGETVYSEQPCGAHGEPFTAPGYDNGIDRAHGWGGHCATDAQSLSDRVAAAFDSGNVNDLGALFLWRGFGTRAAYARLNRLGTLLDKPLAGLDIVADPVPGWPRQGPAVAGLPRSLRIQVADPGMGEDATETWTFPLQQRDGCLWLQYREAADR